MRLLNQKLDIKNLSTFFHWVGFLALCSMALLMMITDKVGDRSAKVMAVLGVLFLCSRWRTLAKSPLVLLVLVAIVIQLLTWVGMQFQHPEWAESSPKVERLLAWFMLIPVAYFLNGDQRKILFVFGLAAFALFISPWVTGGGWQEIWHGLSGGRVDFGVRNAQHVAMLFGVLFITFCALCINDLINKSVSWFKTSLYLLLAVVSLIAVIITQTRAVWLALAAVLCCFVLYCFCRSIQRGGSFKSFAILAIVLVGVFATLSVTNLSNTFEKRIGHELSNITIALSGSDQYRSNTSTGIRLDTWYESLDWISERPVFGWGGNGRDLVVKHTDRLSEENKKIFRHLHNSYLDTLVNFGLLGLLTLVLLFYYLGYITIDLYKKKIITKTVIVTSSLLLIFTGIVNCFESYMYYSSGTHVLALVGGALLSLHWKSTKILD